MHLLEELIHMNESINQQHLSCIAQVIISSFGIPWWLEYFGSETHTLYEWYSLWTDANDLKEKITIISNWEQGILEMKPMICTPIYNTISVKETVKHY